jgi:hypothetical protein
MMFAECLMLRLADDDYLSVTQPIMLYPIAGRAFSKSKDRLSLYQTGMDNSGLWAAGMFDDPMFKSSPCGLLGEDLKPRLRLVAGVLILFLMWGALIFAAAAQDRVLTLPSPGRGLLDHLGYQACFLIGPLILLNIIYGIAYFLRLLRDVDQLLVPDADRAIATEICAPHIRSIFLRSRWKYMLLLLCIIGVAISIANFIPLKHPEDYWGNDVFNAQYYLSSYIAANTYLFLLWSIICPLAFFYIFHVAISTQIIIMKLLRRDMLRLNFLHVDGCGGMAKFGTLNFLLMLIYLWIGFAFLGLHLTHQYNYVGLLFGFAALSIVFIAHSIFGIAWIARAIRTQRDAAVTSLNDRLRGMLDGKKSSFTAAVATMAYRERVMSVASFPYTSGVSFAVNFLRFAPGVLAILKLVLIRNPILL